MPYSLFTGSKLIVASGCVVISNTVCAHCGSIRRLQQGEYTFKLVLWVRVARNEGLDRASLDNVVINFIFW